MPRKGRAPTVQKVAEEAAAEAVTRALPAILRAVGREVAEAVEPAVIAAVQASIASAIQKAVAGATGSAAAPVVSFGTPPRAPAVHQPNPTGFQGGVPQVNSGGGAQAPRPEDMDSPEGRAWLADQLARSNAAQPAVQPQERVAVRTGNLMVDRMLSGGIRQAPRESDFA